MAVKAKTSVIEIQKISMGRLTVNILGTTPMIMHRFGKKAQEELLFPKGRANAAEKAENLKHDPLTEFRETIYKNRDLKEPSFIHVPTDAFSKALANAALDMPGASKSQMLRLVSVTTTQINLFGIPQLGMDMTRSSDMARTPDVRTRAYFPEWACTLDIEYVSSLIKEGNVLNLLGAAGVIVGIGDWRPQKGGSFGKFTVVNADDPDFKRIIKTQGRVTQMAAYENPVCVNAETEELYTWFKHEAVKREKNVPSSKTTDTLASLTAKKKSGNGKETNV